MNEKYIRSCGIIPFRVKGKSVQFLLVKNIGGHWEFPKGHMEKGETERQTAKREFCEETGLKIKKILKYSYFEHYTYVWKGKTKQKKVTYFLGHVYDGKVVVPEDELTDFVWLSYPAALKKLTHSEIREVFRDAKVELKEYLH
jgi:tRNA nucleotidyltransferase (CCA-adding enzyme)